MVTHVGIHPDRDLDRDLNQPQDRVRSQICIGRKGNRSEILNMAIVNPHREKGGGLRGGREKLTQHAQNRIFDTYTLDIHITFRDSHQIMAQIPSYLLTPKSCSYRKNEARRPQKTVRVACTSCTREGKRDPSAANS